MRRFFRLQMELFAAEVRPAELAGAEREKALALLQVLLREALATPDEPATPSDTREATDE